MTGREGGSEGETERDRERGAMTDWEGGREGARE